MFNKMKQANTFSCPNKALYFSREILHDIIERCNSDDRVMLSLVSKEMALNVDRVNSVSKIASKPPKKGQTELQRLNFLIRISSWMGARCLCFGCLRYRPANQKIWYTKTNWRSNKWEGGVIGKHRERAAGPKCRSCAARDMLLLKTAKKDVNKLKDLIMRA